MNTLALREYKACLRMTQRQQQILDGLLLGDGHLERQRGARSARLKVEHCIAQAAYVDWKYAEWEPWVLAPPRLRIKSNRLDTQSTNIGFTTLSHEEFEAARERFYRDGRKIVPADLRLTSLSMAVWYMDDGSRKSRECRVLYLNTQGFNTCDIERLQALIFRDVKAETSVRRQADGLQIYFPSSSVTTLAVYIDDYLLPSMRYKLPG